MKFVLVLLGIGVSLAAQAFETEAWISSHEKELRTLGNSDEWRKVLHYSPHWFRGDSSLLDGPDYFLSPDGKTDPYAELLASVRKLNDPKAREGMTGKLKQPLRCAFPFRTEWLSKRLGLEFPPLGKCELLDTFLGKTNAKSVSLVFSSAYSNNPSSMFGHSLLKLNAKGNSELLDYGVNFAANVSPDENSFSFIWFGLTGGYLGQFSLVPYYEKIREYLDSENRDLWEYELSFTPAEVHFIVLHLWEMETVSWFDYYFADENCSFHILYLLEIMRPDWKLTGNGVFSVPGEMVKHLSRTPGAVVARRFRPSFRQIFYRHIERLSDDQTRDLKALRAAEVTPKSIKSAETLEAYAAWVKYRKPKITDPEWEKKFQEALLARSELGGKTAEVIIPVPEDREPNQGHAPYLVALGGGLLTEPMTVGFQSIQVRFPYHDLLNDDRGFIPYSEIQGLNATIHVNSLRKAGETRPWVSLDRFQVIGITSLAPVSYWDRPLSWRMNFEYLQRYEFGLTSAPGWKLEVGAGWSLDWSPLNSRFALLTGFRGELGSPIHRAGPQAEVMWLATPLPGWKWKLRLETFFNVSSQGFASFWSSVQWEHAWRLAENWELRAGCKQYFARGGVRRPDPLECTVAGRYYF